MPRQKAPKQDSVLKQAIADIADRAEIYGDPVQNHERVAVLMQAWLSIRPANEPRDVLDSVAFQILTNLARLVETPGHKPSWDNIAGYAEIGYEVTNP